MIYFLYDYPNFKKSQTIGLTLVFMKNSPILLFKRN